MTLCEKCGWELRIGDWPYCGEGRDHTPAVAHVIGDEIVGGFVQEHFGHEPEVFYSKSAMARRAKELGLEPFVRYSGDHEQHLTNWAAGIDAYTLESARSLLARGSRPAESSSPGSLETFKGWTREIKKWSEVE